jgi:hypothetical protein
MSANAVSMVVGGTIGLGLAVSGAWMLLAKRAPARTTRVFRCVRDAGFYHLLFGVAMVLVVVSLQLNRGVLTSATTLLAIALVGVAVVRFRPRPPAGGRRTAGK